jgi:hypothetical protein
MVSLDNTFFITSEKKEMDQSYKKIFLLSLLIVLVINSLFRFPIDDGLRHVGLAFSNFTSWGDVYPFSIFEKYKDYDPWFGYDLSLRIIAGIIKHLPISLLTLKFLLTKSLSFLFSLAFCYLVLVRSELLSRIKDRQTFTLAVIIFIALLGLPFGRILLARPFAFGTLFLIYSAGQKGVLRGALSSLVLTFFYPYFSWFYILPVAFTHLIKGDKKFALGAVSFIIIFLLLQPPSFWGFQIALVKSDMVRNAIGPKIQEFHLTLKHWYLYLYLFGFLVLYPKFSKDLRSLTYLNILILIYLLPAVKYIRYFLDLILPLLFVSFGKELIQIIDGPYRKLTSSWKTIVEGSFDNIKSSLRVKPVKDNHAKSSEMEGTGRSLKPYIAVLYLLIFAILIHVNIRQVGSLKEFSDGLMPVPDGSLVLASFNMQYKTLYLRPDLRVIPSCEIGFTKTSVSKEYMSFFNEGLLAPISKKTGANFFLESSDIYVNPQDGRFLKLLKKNSSFKVWKILDPKISDNNTGSIKSRKD